MRSLPKRSPRESYPNPTQQRIDKEGGGEKPVDVSWEEERWGQKESSSQEEQ